MFNNEKYTVANLTSVKMGVRADKYFPKAKRLVFDGMSAQINAVKVGRAHAAQLDLPQALWLMNKFPEDYQVTEDVMEDPNHLGIFMRPGDFKWWLAIDTIVAEWRGGGGYSEYAKIYKKWFGVMPDHTKYYYKKRLVFDGMSAQINAVKVGRAHAAQLDLPQALWLMNKFPEDYQVTEDVMEDPNHLGIFMRPGDFKWWLDNPPGICSTTRSIRSPTSHLSKWAFGRISTFLKRNGWFSMA